VKILAFASFQQ